MSQQPATTQSSVTRTYRAAIRLGEDYVTVEQMVTLPLDASDEEIQQASKLGLRIFTAQHQAMQAEVAQIRADTPTIIAAPRLASDKQRSFIDTLAREVGWDTDALAAFAAEHGMDDWDRMTNTQAAALIDAIKAHKAEQERQRAEKLNQHQEDEHSVRRPDLGRRTQARQALADAEQRTGVGQTHLDLPPIGARIRDPQSPATEAQITKISRTVEILNDNALKRLAPQVAAILGYQRVALKGLRDVATWPYLRDEAEQAHRLTKGRASQIIALLETAIANTKVTA